MKIRARTDGHKGIKRRRLLDSARELFSRQGYGGTTISQITAGARESTGTFYLYFKSKIEIYRILSVEGIGLLRGMMEETLRRPLGDAASRLDAIARTYLEFYRAHNDYYRIIAIMHLGQEEFMSDQDMLAPVIDEMLAMIRVLEGVIQQGMERDEIVPVDAYTVTSVLWGMMDGIMLLDQRSVTGIMNIPIERMLSTAMELSLRGLLKAPDVAVRGLKE
ncbi:MAG: TetR/AcrR family transcriptional regulator [Spirochaetes bacterium]|nr:TetR/AcrR family transcriptional regulator [Spirochaetota bacterium]